MQLFKHTEIVSEGMHNQSKYVLSENRFEKPRQNDLNFCTQHITTLLDATCCARLASLLRSVAACWVLLLKFENGQTWANNYQYVAAGWPNARDMLRPKMSGDVALKCYDRLSGASRGQAESAKYIVLPFRAYQKDEARLELFSSEYTV